MGEIWRGVQQAVLMILGGDATLLEIVGLSLRVSGFALLLATLIGIPLGALMGLRRFHGRRLAVTLLYTGMGFPPVVVGLFVYLMLSRSGPLGSLGWPSGRVPTCVSGRSRSTSTRPCATPSCGASWPPDSAS